MEYAEIRHSSASTCCIWMVDTRVHRPCRTMSSTDRMEGSLEVKGAAMLASPSFTMGSSPVSWSPARSVASAAACAVKALLPPIFNCASSLRRFTSAVPSATDCLRALKVAQPSPARVYSSTSWLYRSICHCFISSAFFLRSVAITVAFSLALRISSSPRFHFSSAVSWTVFFSPSLAVLAPPNPESRASPTCACLRAPTSLAPSPHMSVKHPRSLSARRTASLSSGAMRAHTLMSPTTSHVPTSWSAAARRPSPVMHRSYPFALSSRTDAGV
mmetsp:Transcript_9976/g.24390  ORF Transcript_9976/g.24390 Transcript_9976/m.24390 type:complete len:273 (+) Transcript_9976:1144-1962(+)